MTRYLVDLNSDDDIALAASILREHGREVSRSRFKGQGEQCLRIAEALCNTRREEISDDRIGHKDKSLRS